jgi:hypothetical protein
MNLFAWMHTMDDDTLRRLSADIEDLKRAVKRNDPMLHKVAAPPGWIAFSLAAAQIVEKVVTARNARLHGRAAES